MRQSRKRESTRCFRNAMPISCASCRAPMEALPLFNHLGSPVEIDVCWPCHVIWFDNLESTSLSAGSVIDLFKRIHQARDTGRNTVSLTPACPMCARSLALTSDLTRTGRFSYHRCPTGHGRMTSFAQFLREKQFVRTLQPHELAQMKLTIKQIRCSSCGGPVDLTNDTACTHCGSAISVLDEAAVAKALAGLKQADAAQHAPRDPLRVADAILDAHRAPPRQETPWWTQPVRQGGGIVDLVDLGVDFALSQIFR
jgi:Zn-finger nucleic acid-binding protein